MARPPIWMTRVQSDSMAPFLRHGQLVWTVALPRRLPIRRGAVVAVDSGELGRRIVKRVVGLPGEHLDIEGSLLFVDGQPITERYASPSTGSWAFDVPPAHYLLLGDNRSASSDSRRWRHPYVPRSEIVGRLVTRGARSRPPTVSEP